MKKFLFTLCCALCLLSSCKLRPSSSGNTYEVMVVASDEMWKGEVGKALRKTLNKPIPMLNEEEPSFHVSHVTPDNYDRITNMFRNIVEIHIESDIKSDMRKEYDVFSSPQMILHLQANSDKEMAEYIHTHTDKIVSIFTMEEFKRQMENLEKKHNNDFNAQIKSSFGYECKVPKDLKEILTGDDFVKVSNKGVNTVQTICVYSYPITQETDAFNKEYFMEMRDSIMGSYFIGEKEHSVMQTDHRFVDAKLAQYKGRKFLEVRGLWNMSKDYVGGPFVAHVVADMKSNRALVCEAFVYAPNQVKRSIIRRLEASLYTFKEIE